MPFRTDGGSYCFAEEVFFRQAIDSPTTGSSRTWRDRYPECGWRNLVAPAIRCLDEMEGAEQTKRQLLPVKAILEEYCGTVSMSVSCQSVQFIFKTGIGFIVVQTEDHSIQSAVRLQIRHCCQEHNFCAPVFGKSENTGADSWKSN